MSSFCRTSVKQQGVSQRHQSLCWGEANARWNTTQKLSSTMETRVWFMWSDDLFQLAMKRITSVSFSPLSDEIFEFAVTRSTFAYRKKTFKYVFRFVWCGCVCFANLVQARAEIMVNERLRCSVGVGLRVLSCWEIFGITQFSYLPQRLVLLLALGHFFLQFID